MTQLPKTSHELSASEIEKYESMDINDEFFNITNSLCDYHALFSQIWALGYPKLTFQVPTAAVSFNSEGEYFEFLFNPIFWEKTDTYTKCFVVSHEALHVYLNHGKRISYLKRKNIANQAADIAINHMLCDNFNFDRTKIDLSSLLEKDDPNMNSNETYKLFCWIDTLFSDVKSIKTRESLEYYYKKLRENSDENDQSDDGEGQGQGQGSGYLVDSHDFLGECNSEDAIEKVSDYLHDVLSNEEKRKLNEISDSTKEGREASKDTNNYNKEAGSIAGRLKYTPNKSKIKTSRKWESIIKNWTKFYIGETEVEDQWTRRSRRLDHLPSKLFIPSELENQKRVKNRIDVFFFIDFSGSCILYRDRFFKAAKSLPKDVFNINVYCFDTRVKKISLENPELVGGGGTSFSCLEKYIQSSIKSKEIKQYPDAVFVMTDGYGDSIRPQNPGNWHFFISDYERGKKYIDHCIPKTCQKYNLSEYA